MIATIINSHAAGYRNGELVRQSDTHITVMGEITGEEYAKFSGANLPAATVQGNEVKFEDVSGYTMYFTYTVLRTDEV